MIAFNDANRDREMPFFGQELMLQAQKKGPLTDKAYKEALTKDLRLSRKEGIDAVMDRLHLDAIVAPSGNPPWTTDLINGDHFTGSSTLRPRSLAIRRSRCPPGLPSVNRLNSHSSVVRGARRS